MRSLAEVRVNSVLPKEFSFFDDTILPGIAHTVVKAYSWVRPSLGENARSGWRSPVRVLYDQGENTARAGHRADSETWSGRTMTVLAGSPTVATWLLAFCPNRRAGPLTRLGLEK